MLLNRIKSEALERKFNHFYEHLQIFQSNPLEITLLLGLKHPCLDWEHGLCTPKQPKKAASDNLRYLFLFADDRPFFTREPGELRGEKLQAQLVKSTRGLGFTIVGGDDSEEEFLQIKSVVPNGPAWLDSRLKTGEHEVKYDLHVRSQRPVRPSCYM